MVFKSIHYFLSRSTIISIILIAFIFDITSNKGLCDDENYLNEVDAESSESIHSRTKYSEKDKLLLIKQNNNRNAFEVRLENQFPTTYRTYRMLPAIKKIQVVEVYFKTNKNMTIATRLIYQLYFEIRKNNS
jgi:hypothetical protein